MKFEKVKLKRCNNCVYYKQIGKSLCFCGNTKLAEKLGMKDSYGTIPLICFRKKVKDEIGRK